MAGHIGGLVAGVMLAYVFPVRGRGALYEPNLSDECSFILSPAVPLFLR